MDNFEQYETRLPYPNKSDFQTRYFYRAGKLVATANGSQSTILLEPGATQNDLALAVKETVVGDAALKTALRAYWDDAARLQEQFRQDLFKELDIVDHPKRDLLFQKAYERGHSAGFSEVYQVALDMVDLIKD